MIQDTSLKAEEKIQVLIQLQTLVDESSVLAARGSQFFGFFHVSNREKLEDYFKELDRKKVISYIIYGDPGMLGDYYIKISDYGNVGREISIQIQEIKREYGNIISKMQKENESTRANLERKIEELNDLISFNPDLYSGKIMDVKQKVQDIRKKIPNDENFNTIVSVLNDTEHMLGVFNTVSDNYYDILKYMVKPMEFEFKKTTRTVIATAVASILGAAFISIIINLFI